MDVSIQKGGKSVAEINDIDIQTISVEELRLKTLYAIAAGKQKKEAADVIKRKSEEAEIRVQIARAHAIAKKIPNICQKAAQEGNFNAKVFRLCDQDCHVLLPGKPTKVLQVESRRPDIDSFGYGIFLCPQLVFDYCKAIGLNPKFQQWDDGIGQSGGLELWVSWE